MSSQAEIRKQKRALRAALDEAQLQRAAGRLCTRLLELDFYREAQQVAAYFAVDGEISLAPLIEHALAQGKRVYLPNLEREALRFSPYFHGQKMRINRYRLPEPDVDDEAMLAPRELDLVLVPLVAFDSGRNRIGMGGGYYDRSFAFRKDPHNNMPRLVGVAHEIQKVDRIDAEEWDVCLDLVVTDAAIYG